MKKINILFFVTLIVFFTACKSKQSVVPQMTTGKTKNTELIQKVRLNEPQFSTANVSKMSLYLNLDGRTFNVSASCKIRTDSAMHISIQPALGIEMFKLEITPDSILAFDKINKRLYATDFKLFETKFGLTVNYFDLQSLISNRLFTVGSAEFSEDKCTIEALDDLLSKIIYKNDKITQTTEINNQLRIQKTELKSNTSDYVMAVDYSEFSPIDGIVFPQKIKLKALSKKHAMNCDFSISRVVFNNRIGFSSIDPARYETELGFRPSIRPGMIVPISIN